MADTSRNCKQPPDKTTKNQDKSANQEAKCCCCNKTLYDTVECEKCGGFLHRGCKNRHSKHCIPQITVNTRDEQKEPAHMSARSSAHSAAKVKEEKRREDEYVKWDHQVEYYKSCDEASHRSEDWSHDSNNLKQEQQHKDQLEERHEKLEKLLDKEDERKRHGAERALDLEKQIEELHIKQTLSEVLQKEEEDAAKKLSELFDIEERHHAEWRLKENRELVLQNLEHHKMKLKEKAAIVQEDLERDQNLIKYLVESDMADRIEDENKREEVKKVMTELLKHAREQQELEGQRRENFDSVYESEAKLVYDRQHQVWLEEEKARKARLKDLMDTLKQQVDEKLQKKKLKRLEVLKEHETTVRLLKEFERDIRKGKEVEQQRKKELGRDLEEQIEEKKNREKKEKRREQRLDDRDEKLEWKVEDNLLTEELQKSHEHTPSYY